MCMDKSFIMNAALLISWRQLNYKNEGIYITMSKNWYTQGLELVNYFCSSVQLNWNKLIEWGPFRMNRFIRMNQTFLCYEWERGLFRLNWFIRMNQTFLLYIWYRGPFKMNRFIKVNQTFLCYKWERGPFRVNWFIRIIQTFLLYVW